MQSVRGQRLLATGLILVSVIWYWLVIKFIEVPAGGEGPDSRTFPIFFGALLGFFALLLWVQTLFAGPKAETTEKAAKQPREDTVAEVQAVMFMILSLTTYAVLLETLGFVLATILTLLLVLGVVLGVRCVKKITFITLGLSAGTYIIFKQVLGVYLPLGSLINIGM